MKGNDEEPSTLASRLREALDASGMNQTQLEERARLPKGYASRVLAGKRKLLSPDLLHRLSQALLVRYEWLAVGEGERPLKKENGRTVQLQLLPSSAALISSMAVRFPAFSLAIQASRIMGYKNSSAYTVACRFVSLERDMSADWWLAQLTAARDEIDAMGFADKEEGTLELARSRETLAEWAPYVLETLEGDWYKVPDDRD